MAVVLAVGTGCSAGGDEPTDTAGDSQQATTSPSAPALDTSSPAALVAQLRTGTGEWEGCTGLQTRDGVPVGQTELSSDGRNARISAVRAPSGVVVDGRGYVRLSDIGITKWRRADPEVLLANLGELRCDLVLDALEASATAVAPHDPVSVKALDSPAASVTVDLRAWLESLDVDAAGAAGSAKVVVALGEFGLAHLESSYAGARTTTYSWGLGGPDVAAPDPENIEPSTA